MKLLGSALISLLCGGAIGVALGIVEALTHLGVEAIVPSMQVDGGFGLAVGAVVWPWAHWRWAARRRPDAPRLGMILATCLVAMASPLLTLRFAFHNLEHNLSAETVGAAIAAAIVSLAAAEMLGRALMSVPQLPLRGLLVLSWVGAGVVGVGDQFGGGSGADRADAQASKPDMMVILIDCLRADHLGSYGYPKPTSPNLDALAAEGVRFESCISTASWTKPAVTSLMTSLFPSSVNGADVGARVPQEVVTLAESLESSGYHNSAISSSAWVSPRFGFDQGFHEFDDGVVLAKKTWVGESLMWLDLWADPFFALDATSLTRSAMPWAARAPAGPSFLYLHYFDPHEPYSPPEQYLEPFLGDLPRVHKLQYPVPEVLPFDADPGNPFDARETASLIAHYDGEILYTDTKLGELFDQLRASGRYDETMIVITADHGEEFNEHGGWGHGQSLHDELVRVPLIIKPPKSWNVAPTVVSVPVSLVDIAPTLAATAEGATPAEPVPAQLPPLLSEGRSLLPLLAEPDPDEEEPVYAEGYHVARRDDDQPSQTSVILGRWKLHTSSVRSGEVVSLYDLTEDPNEMVDRSGEFGDVMKHLQRLIDRWLQRPTRGSYDGEDAVMDPQLVESLRAVGYLHDGAP